MIYFLSMTPFLSFLFSPDSSFLLASSFLFCLFPFFLYSLFLLISYSLPFLSLSRLFILLLPSLPLQRVVIFMSSSIVHAQFTHVPLFHALCNALRFLRTSDRANENRAVSQWNWSKRSYSQSAVAAASTWARRQTLKRGASRTALLNRAVQASELRDFSAYFGHWPS